MTQRNYIDASAVEDGETTDAGSGFDSRRLHQSTCGIIRDSGGSSHLGTESAQKVPNRANPTYVDRPTFEPPRAVNRLRQDWNTCRNCSLWYAAPAKELNQGKRVYCSRKCSTDHFAATGRFAGENNPRWLGGVSTDNMRYRNRQKERWPEREECRYQTRLAVDRGELVRQPCACGNPKSQAHHHDYTKPLEVEWLCRACHDAEHAEVGRGDGMVVLQVTTSLNMDAEQADVPRRNA